MDATFKITISEEHKSKLDALADAKGISIDELIEQLIDDIEEK